MLAIAEPFGRPDADVIETIQRIGHSREPQRRFAQAWSATMTADYLGLSTVTTGFVIWAISWLIQMWKPETWRVMSCVSPVGGSLILVGTIIAIAESAARLHQ
jgi:hypothetical protein